MSRYHDASGRIAGGTPARTYKGLDVLVDISNTSDYGEEGFFLVEVFEPGTGKSIGQLDVTAAREALHRRHSPFLGCLAKSCVCNIIFKPQEVRTFPWYPAPPRVAISIQCHRPRLGRHQ